MLRVLVIGAGSIGRRHAANLARLGCEVTLLPWRETSAQDVAARLAGMDAAVIATATDIRLPLVAACGAAGVPFYCEKPLAFRQADLDAIAAAAAPVAGRSAVGFMMRYHEGFRRLAGADLSQVFRFAFAIGHDVTQWRADWRFSDSYAARATGGGVLLDLCHEIDMAACLLPGLTLVACESLGHVGYPGIDVASHLTFRAANGAVGSIAMDYLAPALIREARIDTLTGPVTMDFAAGRFMDEPVPQDRNAMFLALMRDFLMHVQGNPVADPLFPAFDRVQDTCRLIAQAWEARRITGTIAKDIP
ncbi:MAG: Gfo/Idh/MocA family protein [Gemmobacter sp.]